MNTRDSLTIWWAFEGLDESGIPQEYHEESFGLTVYGWWGSHSLAADIGKIELAELGWGVDSVEWKFTNWDDLGIVSMDILVKEWPADGDFKDCVGSTLMWFSKQGAKVVWCGGEDSAPTLEVFNHQAHAGNVYACYLPTLGLMFGSGLDEEYQCLEDEKLLLIGRDLERHGFIQGLRVFERIAIRPKLKNQGDG